jgi:hypothetical protein
MKRKNSIKDILKGKKTLIVYKGESKAGILKKPMREYEMCSPKEK